MKKTTKKSKKPVTKKKQTPKKVVKKVAKKPVRKPIRKLARKSVAKRVTKKTLKREVKKNVKKASTKKTPVKKGVVKKAVQNKKWQPLRELALHTPYTMGYLSLMARRNQLLVKKNGRIWYSTVEDIKEFEEKMKKQKDERNNNLRKSYQEKAEKVKISVMDDKKAEAILEEVQKDTEKVSNNIGFTKKTSVRPVYKNLQSSDSIFDEVQNELQDILSDIKNKEKKLRHNYMIYRGRVNSGEYNVSQTDIQERKGNTEQISEKLISDVGKLLKTVNEIQNIAEDEVVVNENTRGPRVKSLQNGEHLLGNYHRDNFLSVPYSYFPFEDRRRSAQEVPTYSKILLFVAGAMVFVAAVLLTLAVFG